MSARSLYMGWNHDVRFFRLYQVPLALWAWMSGGESYRPAEAVVTQDGVIALLASCALAAVLVRSHTWRQSSRLRAGCAVVSVLIPWQPFIQTFHYPNWYATATSTFAIGYVLTSVAAFIAPVSRGMRVALLGVALASGVGLATWRLERWDWLLAGNLIAAFVLLVYCLLSALLWEPRSRPTRG